MGSTSSFTYVRIAAGCGVSAIIAATIIAQSIISPADTMTQPPLPNGLQPSDFYSPGSYTPFESVGFLMRKVLSSILQQADAQLAEHELTYVQWLPLYKLLLCSDATNAGMARDLGLDPASITRALDRLESKGMLRRERSTVDRRVRSEERRVGKECRSRWSP